MVSFWPWKGDDQSAASFEKKLSLFSQKISTSSSKNDSLRRRARRSKVLWTLWSTFAYILAAIILTFVTGWQNWTAVEWTVVAGGPVLLYGVRAALTAFYDYRISSNQSHLDSLYAERDKTIDKLKEATKYNSTQQLLEKYGSPRSTPKKSAPSPEGKSKKQSERRVSGGPVQRTGFVPPPTANIPRNNAAPPLPRSPSSPQAPSPQQQRPPQDAAFAPPAQADGPPSPMVGAEFAPNAYSAPPQYAPSSGPAWYDRLMDAIMGEDETQPRNRIVLICQNCRVVNGQAPPGTKSLHELGRWKCMNCGGWNGVESETQKLVQSVTQGAGEQSGEEPQSPYEAPSFDEADEVQEDSPIPGSDEDIKEESTDDVGESEQHEVHQDSPAQSTRSKAKNNGKKGRKLGAPRV